MFDALLGKIRNGDIRSLSRAISLVENESPGYEHFLKQLPFNNNVRVTGITGPPGAGKSTVADMLIGRYIQDGQRVAVICVDPSSPFTDGALLGDRIRMREWYNHPDVFIRSLSSRGTLGGLNPAIIPICDVIATAHFDQIIIETVGVGQNEIGIAALADCTVVLLVPESGDDIQNMKSGLLEIADIFGVNKCDRPGADFFITILRSSIHELSNKDVPIVRLTASEKQGIQELTHAIATHHHQQQKESGNKVSLFTERAYQLIVRKRIKTIDKRILQEHIARQLEAPDFNLYQIVDTF